MTRKMTIRKIGQLPMIKGFRPFGWNVDHLRIVTLSLEEVECVRLLDYEGKNQDTAAVDMEISRPTLTRIYESARKKIAKAFIEGQSIVIEGGNVDFKEQWIQCERCHQLIKDTEPDETIECPSCNSDKLFHVNQCYFGKCHKCRKCHQK